MLYLHNNNNNHIAAFSLKSHVKPSVYISTSGCTELGTLTCSETSLRVGSRVTISQLETSLTELRHQLPGTDASLKTDWLWLVGNSLGNFAKVVHRVFAIQTSALVLTVAKMIHIITYASASCFSLWLGTKEICCPKCHFSSVQNHQFRPKYRPNFEFSSKCSWDIERYLIYWFPSPYKEMQHFFRKR